jgi:RNAse (barnase) inhibitor barstar
MSWEAFHNHFARTFGFPDFYGRNMNAWIDCMGDLDSPENGMTKNISVKKGESLELVIYNSKELVMNNREIYNALVECTESNNQRRREVGEVLLINLTFKE